MEAFDQDREEMIQRALSLGIDQFYIPAIDSSYSERMLSLKKAYPDHVQLMTGLHPTHVKQNVMEELAHVNKMLAIHNFVAIGEIGIDLYWDTSFKQAQQDAFDYQIKLAVAHNLPIVIHCRAAFEEVFEILEENRSAKMKGIFHCFTGNLQDAQRAIGHNLKLGIGGVVTFKNGKIDQFLDQLPLESIVLESDAPYLAPVPHRGKRNESAYLVLVAQKLAEIYQCSVEKIANQTSLNAKSVFV